MTDLDALFTALRLANVPTGVRQLAWVRHALQLEPALELEDLRAIVRLATVRTPEEAQAFDRVWEDWERGAASNLPPVRVEQPIPAERAPHPVAPEPRRARHSPEPAVSEKPPVTPVIIVILALVAMAMVQLRDGVSDPVILLSGSPGPAAEAPAFAPPADPVAVTAPPTSDNPKPPGSRAPETRDNRSDAKPVGEESPASGGDEESSATSPADDGAPRSTRDRRWTAFVPMIRKPEWSLPPPELLVGLLMVTAAAATGHLLRRRFDAAAWLADVPPPARTGPRRLPLAEGRPPPADRLDPRSARSLVWGVTRYVDESRLPDLDLPGTVEATARAGELVLVHQQERNLRQVWLWVDQTCSDVADEYARQLAHTLRAGGLEARIGHFDGVPDRVRWEEGDVFRPETAEAHRETALVTILTDGRVLARQLARDDRVGTVNALLRQLGDWPRLVVADFGDKNQGLALLLAPHGIRVLPPNAAPSFLADGLPPASHRARRPPVRSALRRWRGALALCFEPVSQGTARALRRWLALPLSDWDWEEACKDHEAAGAWTCDDSERSALIRDLPPRMRREAARFWRGLREREDTLRRADALRAWDETRARDAWAMEVALLDLWLGEQEAIGATERLWALYGGELRDTIRARLAVIGEVCPPPTNPGACVRLGAMGHPGLTLRRPPVGGGLAKALAVCWGLGLSGAVVCVVAVLVWSVPIAAPSPESGGAPGGYAYFTREDLWTADLVVATARTRATAQLLPFHVSYFSWREESRACVKDYPRFGAEVHWCSTVSLLERPELQAFLVEPTADPTVNDALAGALLDTGTAIFVAVGAAVPPSVELPGVEVFTISEREDSTADVVVDYSVAVEASRRGVNGSTLAQVWPFAARLSARAAAATLGRMPVPTHPIASLPFVRIPSGSFRPAGPDSRLVSLSSFDLTKFEVTNVRYRAKEATHEGSDFLPAVGLTWFEAAAYCRWLGETDPDYEYRLPTDLEWEYAARGDDGRTYPWGEATPDDTLAVFGGAALEHAGSRPDGKGPFGAYDQAGSVLEWVADWFDPAAPEAGRAVRGGAFDQDATALGTAVRAGRAPDRGYPNVGFRCVRTLTEGNPSR